MDEQLYPPCPQCWLGSRQSRLQFIGSVGFQTWGEERFVEGFDVQADRYDCPNGHSVLIVDTDRLQED